jgi:hypothetical protein
VVLLRADMRRRRAAAPEIFHRRDQRNANHSTLIRSFLIVSGRRPLVFGIPCEKKFWCASTRAKDAAQTKNRCAVTSIERVFARFYFARKMQLSLISSIFLQHRKIERVAFERLQKCARTSRAIEFIPLPQGSARGRCTHFVKPKTVFFVVL